LHTGREHSVQWFQKILSELLGHTQTNVPVLSSAATTVDREEEADPKPSEPDPTLLRATRSVWGPAAESYERLIEQLHTMQVTADAARKIWPVSIAILLVTLATRRQIVSHVAEAKVPPVAELVGRFLNAFFTDRCQGWRHGLDEDRIGPTDPAVAAMLQETHAILPTQDIAAILRLLFAFQHPHNLSLDGWLLFQEIAPHAMKDGPPPEEFENLCRRYLSAEAEGFDWRQMSSSWEAVSRLGWSDHPGFQELRALAWHADKQNAVGVEPPLPERLRELWQQTERRIRNGKRWRCNVSRLDRYCTADGCPLSFSLEPANRDLANLRPVICRGCGSVLVPDRLAKAFGE